MENNLVNKAKFFAQYFNQNVFRYGNDMETSFLVYWKLNTISSDYYLELTNIDNITDEHAKILGFENASDFFIDGSTYAMIDDLRLLGYAVDWSDLSVDELIEFGWIKLKTE